MINQEPPYIYEGYDPATGQHGRGNIGKIIYSVAETVGDAIRRNREPGRPLHTLSNVVREAPLGAVCVAFVLGVAFATRKVNSRR